jgi:hypothetical protein
MKLGCHPQPLYPVKKKGEHPSASKFVSKCLFISLAKKFVKLLERR